MIASLTPGHENGGQACVYQLGNRYRSSVIEGEDVAGMVEKPRG